MAGFEGSAWDEEEDPPPDHQYYNDFPGKEPPLGGVVDLRLRDGTTAALSPNHLGATLVREVVACAALELLRHVCAGPPSLSGSCLDSSRTTPENVSKGVLLELSLAA